MSLWLVILGQIFFYNSQWGIGLEGINVYPQAPDSHYSVCIPLSCAQMGWAKAVENCDGWTSGLFWKGISSLMWLICWAVAPSEQASTTITIHLLRTLYKQLEACVIFDLAMCNYVVSLLFPFSWQTVRMCDNTSNWLLERKLSFSFLDERSVKVQTVPLRSQS